MQERHTNRKQYFNEQAISTRKYVVPYIEAVIPVTKETKVLEIGCGEGGNILPFLEKGCDVIGVDLNEGKLKMGREWLSEALPGSTYKLINQDIYEWDLSSDEKFDLIILRDVIEHIHDQDRFMGFMKSLLTPNGKVFFGFPPWYMPFGGHQQICKKKLTSVAPWYHLLPMPLFKMLLKAFGESERVVESLVEIKDTGISTARFLSIVKKHNYSLDKKTRWFINPNYEIKFNLKQRVLIGPLASIPFFRDFFTTCFYCVIGNK